MDKFKIKSSVACFATRNSIEPHSNRLRRRGWRIKLESKLDLVPRETRSMSPFAHFSRPLIVVVGMHRSGTSLCSNMLSAMGVDMSDEIGTGRGNEKGHWERWDIVNLQDQILELFDRSYWSGKHLLPLPLPVDWMAEPRIKPIFQNLRNIISDLVGRGRLVGFKDPRTIKFLPIWRQIFSSLEIEPIYIYCIRRPSSVAKSLKMRDNFSINYSEYLWMEYNYDCLKYLNRKKATLIVYEDWMDAPEKNISKLIDTTGGGENELIDLLQIIDKNMNHSQEVERSSLPFYDLVYKHIIPCFDGGFADYSQELQQIINYQAVVRQMNRGFEFAIDHNVQRAVRPVEERAEGLSVELDVQRQVAGELKERRAAIEAELHTERDQREGLEYEREALTHALEAQRQVATELNERRAAIEAELHTERGQREGLAQEREALTQALEAQRQAAEELEGRRAAIDAELYTLQQNLEACREELNRAEQQRTTLTEELDQIRSQSLVETLSSRIRRRGRT